MNIPVKAARKQADLALPLIRQLEEAVAQCHPVDNALRHFYRAHPEFGSRDRRFFSALVFSWFRWRGWLAPPDAARCAMAYLLDAVESHPAAMFMAERPDLQPSGSLELAAKSKQTGAWLNVAAPLIGRLVPDWFPARAYIPAQTEPREHCRCCIAAFQVRPAAWLRIERGLAEPLGAALARHAVSARPHPQIAGALQLQGAANLEQLPADIRFEIQDLASQCVGLICAPARGETWWDTCAGAGGKTLHLADLMGQQGEILATDARAGSLANLKKRARGRARNMITCHAWEGNTDPAPGRQFDGVLVDAPCSGLGTWARNPDARWRTTENDIDRWQAVQKRLLREASGKVRPGGYLVYAVCTLTEAETMVVIRDFLETQTGFQLDAMPHPLTGLATDGTIWIWPWEADSNGMFIARLRRNS